MGSATGDNFAEFMAIRLSASTAFVNGDVEPLLSISAQEAPATIFGPAGDTVEGPDEVNAVNARGAANFEAGGTNSFQVLHQAADDDLAYWTGIQRSVVRIKGQDEPIPMALRVTEIFRRDDGRWTLVHRHADQLKTGG